MIIDIYWDTEYSPTLDILGGCIVSPSGETHLYYDFETPPIFQLLDSYPDVQTVKVWFKWSDRDLLLLLGEKIFTDFCQRGLFEKMGKWIGQGYLDKETREVQKRKSKNSVRIELCDLQGWNPGSLKEMALATGYPEDELDKKDLLKPYITDLLPLWEGIIPEYPDTAGKELIIEYFLNDLKMTKHIGENFIPQLNTLITEAHPSIKALSVTKPPKTIGRLVSKVFENYLKTLHPDIMKALGHISLYNSGINLSDKSQYSITDKGLLEHKHYKSPIKPVISGVGLCSKEYFEVCGEGNGLLPAIVQGGRCVNENPSEVYLEDVLDIDLKSCYGSALNRLPYFLGQPKIYNYHSGEKPVSLKKFLRNRKNDLVENGFVIYVSGNLSKTSQDLIYSTLLTKRGLTRLKHSDLFTSDKWFEEDNLVTLLRKEIKYGIVTSDILEVIERVASSTEKKEFNELQVLSAVYYPKSRRCETIDEFVEECLKHDIPKHYSIRGGRGQSIIKGGCKKWYSFKIGDYLSPFLELRNHYKSLGMKAQSNSLKLLNNTLYGVLCSRFFSIGNIVVANNITASARRGVWMMSKALGTVNSITDGGLFSINKVRYLRNVKGKKPSLTELSNYQSLNNHYNVRVGTLAQINNQGCYEHIKDFWFPYDLEFKFEVELKHEEKGIIPCASYLNRADYCLRFLSGEELIKVRGVKQSDPFYDKNPKIRLLRQVIEHKGLDFPWNLVLDNEEGVFKTTKITSMKELLHQGNNELISRVGLSEIRENILYLRKTHNYFSDGWHYKRVENEDRSFSNLFKEVKSESMGEIWFNKN